MAPLPFGWKLCFSVVAKTICLRASPVVEAPALELALAELELELLALAELELELELELEHPAAPSRPAATTVAPSRVAVRRLKFFIVRLVLDPSDVRRSGVKRADERPVTINGPDSTHLVNAALRGTAGMTTPGMPGQR
jgi:hypothetical protein